MGDFVVVIPIGGSGVVIPTGFAEAFPTPRNGVFTSYEMLADQSGSIVIDIWKNSFGNLPPTDADSITASAPLTISSNIKSQNTSLTGWTPAFLAKDWFTLNVDSVTAITRLTIALYGHWT